MKIGGNIKKFGNVEDIPGKMGKKMMSPNDKVVLKMVDKSIKDDGERYEGAYRNLFIK